VAMALPSRRLLLSAAVALLGLAGAAHAADLADVKRRGTLRVLVVYDAKRPEFFAKKADRPGFDREVLGGFVALHKLKLEPIGVSGWDALIPALLADKGDVIAGRFTATEQRRKSIDFSAEVFPTRNVVITRKPHKVVRSLDELKAEKVGTTKGSSMAEAIADAGVPAANVDDGVPPGGYGEALASGRVTAAVWGVESAIALQRDDPAIQLGVFLGPPASMAYGVRKEHAELKSALNEYIENLRRTPTWNRLVVKYFGEAAPEILKKARTESRTE
jgi:ABC-type amino acid transport substrate-binding protein